MNTKALLEQQLGQLPDYQNKERIVIQCSELFRKYTELSPRIDMFVFNNGSEEMLLRLFGTIPIHFHGNSYNIPICAWFLKDFPKSSPVCYVLPSNDMIIKKDHMSVNSHGYISVPTILNWNRKNSTVISTIDELVTIFSSFPPLFRKKKKNKSRSPSQPSKQHKPSLSKEDSIENSMKSILWEKVYRTISDNRKDVVNQLNELFQRQDRLNQSRVKLRKNYDVLEHHKLKSKKTIQQLKSEIASLSSFLQNEENKNQEKLPIDQIVTPQDTWSQQVFHNVAKDHAIEDTMYVLDRALQDGVIDLHDFIKNTRKLAQMQFMSRALVKKIVNEQQKLYSH